MRKHASISQKFCGFVANSGAILLSLLGSPAAVGAALPPAPANDDLANATVVTGTEFSLTADLGAATVEPFEVIARNGRSQTAWWRWIAPADGIYAWDTGGSSNAVAVAVYQSDTFSGLIPVAESGTRPDLAHGAILVNGTGSFQASEGLEYLIQLDGVRPIGLGLEIFLPPTPGPNPVSVDIHKLLATPPVNDDFAGRLVLSGTNAVFSGDLTAASREIGEPSGPYGLINRTLWWKWQAPGYGNATIRFSGTGEAPAVSIYHRGQLESLELTASSATEFGIVCSETLNYSFTQARTSVDWETAPDTEYEIQLDRYTGMPSTGPFGMELNFTAAPLNDTPAGAIQLLGNDTSLPVSNLGATTQKTEPIGAHYLGSKSVWYEWAAAQSGLLQVSTEDVVRYDDPNFVVPSSSDDGSVTVTYTCSSLEDLHPLPAFVPGFALFKAPTGGDPAASLDNYNRVGTNGFVAQIPGSGKYFIDFFGLADTAGSATLNLLFMPPPTNDAFASRIILPSSEVRAVGRTFAATSEGLDPVYGTSAIQGLDGSQRTVWWEWAAPSTGTWLIRTESTDNDDIFVFRGSSPLRTNIAAHSVGSFVPFDCAAGEKFIIGAFSHSEFGGNVAFRIASEDSVSFTIAPAPVTGPQGQAGFLLKLSSNFGINYQLETSTDLIHWQPLVNYAIQVGEVPVYPNDGEDHAFYRRVRLP